MASPLRFLPRPHRATDVGDGTLHVSLPEHGLQFDDEERRGVGGHAGSVVGSEEGDDCCVLVGPGFSQW